MLENSHRVTVVTVSYNSEAVLPRMLDSIPVGVPVIIVDNASRSQTSIQQIANRYSALALLNEKNVGFGVACNRGAELASSEFIFFLNPDAILMPGTIDALLEAADRYPMASAFCPRETDGGGRPVFKRKTDLAPRREWMPHGWPPKDRAVIVMHGAAMLIRATAFARVGGFDPSIFLFYEDDDLSIRLRKEYGPLMFIRAALVQHAGGQSSGADKQVEEFKALHFGFSQLYATRKHGRHLRLATTIISVTFKAACSILPMKEARRTKRRAVLRGAVHALRGGRSMDLTLG